MTEAPSPEEQLRRALLDLERAHRQFARSFGREVEAEAAARLADEARTQAAHWGAIARASAHLHEED